MLATQNTSHSGLHRIKARWPSLLHAMQLTREYAHELAQLKARLMEKDAQLMGGFGNPIKLAHGDWSEPPFTPAAINSETGSEAAVGGTHPFGFEAFMRSQALSSSCAAPPGVAGLVCNCAVMLAGSFITVH